jgi:hypothetical protein
MTTVLAKTIKRKTVVELPVGAEIILLFSLPNIKNRHLSSFVILALRYAQSKYLSPWLMLPQQENGD